MIESLNLHGLGRVDSVGKMLRPGSALPTPNSGTGILCIGFVLCRVRAEGRRNPGC